MKKTGLFIVCALIIGILGGYVSQCQGAEPKIDLRALVAKRVPILLEFGSNCCPSCQYSKQIHEDLTNVYGGKAVLTGVDVVVNKDLAREFKIRLTPTQVFLTPDGKEFFRKEGPLERDQIIQVFSKMGLQAPKVQSRGPVAVPRPVLPSVPGYSASSQ